MAIRQRRGRCQKGQSLLEVAIATPVLLLLLYGVLTVGMLISDRVTSGYAARQGARVAALLGGCTVSPCVPDPSLTDRTIVQNVLAVARTLSFASIKEVDIYPANCTPSKSAACQASGMYKGAPDPMNRYGPDAASIGGTPFALDQRNQLVPTETSIGVRIIYQYVPPITFEALNLTEMDYAVMKLSPVSDS